MSIEFLLLQDTSASEHEERIKTLRNQGFERVFSKVMWADTDALLFIAYMERDTAQTTVHKNGVYLASLLEVLEKRLNEVLDRLEVIESTLDDDSTSDDLAAPTAWARQQQLVPTSEIIVDDRDLPAWYREAIDEGVLEDELREGGNHG